MAKCGGGCVVPRRAGLGPGSAWMFLIGEVGEVCCQSGSPNPVAWLASDVQDSRARLRFWIKTLFRRRTMNADFTGTAGCGLQMETPSQSTSPRHRDPGCSPATMRIAEEAAVAVSFTVPQEEHGHGRLESGTTGPRERTSPKRGLAPTEAVPPNPSTLGPGLATPPPPPSPPAWLSSIRSSTEPGRSR